MGLRNKDVPITNPVKKNINQQSNINTDKTVVDKYNTNKEHLEAQKGKKPLREIIAKVLEIRKETIILREILSSFNLENEISKIKISFPFNEILRNSKYRAQ